MTGTGEYLKIPEPECESRSSGAGNLSGIIRQARAGAHKIQGIGAGFVPDVLNTKIYDEIFEAENEDAFPRQQNCWHTKRASLVGISSGAALLCSDPAGKTPGK